MILHIAALDRKGQRQSNFTGRRECQPTWWLWPSPPTQAAGSPRSPLWSSLTSLWQVWPSPHGGSLQSGPSSDSRHPLGRWCPSPLCTYLGHQRTDMTVINWTKFPGLGYTQVKDLFFLQMWLQQVRQLPNNTRALVYVQCLYYSNNTSNNQM